VFLARDKVEMPPPGDQGTARLTITLRDLVWDFIYAPVTAAVRFGTEKLNYLQFLTIRSYLSLVFAALVALLLGVSLWP
jgi:hypothetical protein